MMRLFAIGFTKKKAREFFGLLSDSGAMGSAARIGDNRAA